MLTDCSYRSNLRCLHCLSLLADGAAMQTGVHSYALELA